VQCSWCAACLPILLLRRHAVAWVSCTPDGKLLQPRLGADQCWWQVHSRSYKVVAECCQQLLQAAAGRELIQKSAMVKVGIEVRCREQLMPEGLLLHHVVPGGGLPQSTPADAVVPGACMMVAPSQTNHRHADRVAFSS
jgi:hypothetical protein